MALLHATHGFGVRLAAVGERLRVVERAPDAEGRCTGGRSMSGTPFRRPSTDCSSGVSRGTAESHMAASALTGSWSRVMKAAGARGSPFRLTPASALAPAQSPRADAGFSHTVQSSVLS